LPLAPRTIALLRLTLHLPPELPSPDAEQVRAAVEALLHAAKAEGGLTVRHCCGVVAVFGVAGPSPDDAGLALRAARAALTAVENLGGGFTGRAAIDLGSALVGNIGGVDAYELAVLGEMVERLERILAVVAPGEILAGPGASGLAGAEPAGWMQVGAEEIRVARVGRG
jgi:class 3 adenylate cyclase